MAALNSEAAPTGHRRRVAFVIYEGFQSLDLTGPYEVFQHVQRLERGYDCRVVAPVAGPVRAHSG
ncbi:AraC family transcriptional regulator, partial [Actinomadura adrarensis]